MSKSIINGIELELTSEQAKEVLEKYGLKKDSGWHDGASDHYIYLDSYSDTCNGSTPGTELYDCANAFTTKEKAEQINFQQTLWRKIQRFADEHNEGDIDWGDTNQKKWYIWYDYTTDDINVNSGYQSRHLGKIGFTSKETATQCLDEFKDELVKYFKGDL